MPATLWTPRTLIRSTAIALRQRPSLALPVLVADLLAFTAMHLQKFLQKPLLELVFTSRQSVLSNHTAFTITPAQTHDAQLLITALVFVTYFFSGLFYTAALISVATMIGRRPILPTLAAKKAPLLRFALFFWALLIGGWFVSAPVLSFVSSKWVVEHTHGIGLAYFAAIILESIIAIFALGPGLRLLNPTAKLSDLAVFAAIITLLVQGAIDLAFRQLPLNTIFQNPSVFNLITLQLIVSLLAAIPYIFLFTTLSLIAAGPSFQSADSDDQSPELPPDLASDPSSVQSAPEKL